MSWSPPDSACVNDSTSSTTTSRSPAAAGQAGTLAVGDRRGARHARFHRAHLRPARCGRIHALSRGPAPMVGRRRRTDTARARRCLPARGPRHPRRGEPHPRTNLRRAVIVRAIIRKSTCGAIGPPHGSTASRPCRTVLPPRGVETHGLTVIRSAAPRSRGGRVRDQRYRGGGVLPPVFGCALADRGPRRPAARRRVYLAVRQPAADRPCPAGSGLAQHRGHGKAPLDILRDVGGQPLGSGRS